MTKDKKLVTLTANQVNFIEKISRDKQISFSDALRRILDNYMESNQEKKS
jgi:hypothetical protein